MKSLKKILFCILLFYLCLGVKVFAQSSEYMIKAGFIERFTRFITYPVDYLSESEQDPFIIKIIGDNPFDGELEQFYEKTTIKGHPVRIVNISTLEDITPCHLLFIAKTENDLLDEIISRIKSQPIISVSETRRYGQKGVMINFYSDNNKVRFEINKSTVDQSGLDVSYLLLNIARIIE